MKSLFRKELLEVIGLACLLAVGLVIAWCNDVRPRHWFEADDEHFAALFLGALFLGVVLGHGQILVESWRGTWGYLLHRGTRRLDVLRAKRRAAWIVGALCVLLPVWIAYGIEAFDPESFFHWDRLFELAAVAAWFVPSYALAQWQALSNAGRRGEWLFRFALSIVLAGAPFAWLSKLDLAWLEPPSGLLLLLTIGALLSWLGLTLANRRYLARATSFRSLPPGELIVSASFGVVVLAFFAMVMTHESRRGAVRSLEEGYGKVYVDQAGQLATWRRAADGFRFVTSDGEELTWSRVAVGQVPPDWDLVRDAAWERRDREVKRGRFVPFLFSKWVDLGSAWREREHEAQPVDVHDAYFVSGSGRLFFTMRSPATTETWAVIDETGVPLEMGPDAVAVSVSFGSIQNEATQGAGFVLFAAGREQLAFARVDQPAIRFTLPAGDVPLHFRVERELRNDGYTRSQQLILVGEAREYRWHPATLNFEPWVDPSPSARTMQIRDAMSSLATVESLDKAIDRSWVYSRPRSIKVARVALGTWLRPPLVSAASTWLKTPERPSQRFLWTHVLDWNVARGRRPVVLVIHLLIGAACALLAGRLTRGRSQRSFWIVLSALFGPIGLLWTAIETSGRRPARTSASA